MSPIPRMAMAGLGGGVDVDFRSPAVTAPDSQTGVGELRDGDAPGGRFCVMCHGAQRPMDVPSSPALRDHYAVRHMCMHMRTELTRGSRSQGAAWKSPAASAPPLAALGGLSRQISTHRPPPALRQAGRAILHARWPQRTSTTGTRALWPAEPSIRPSSALCLRPSKAGRGALAKDIGCEGTEPAAAR